MTNSRIGRLNLLLLGIVLLGLARPAVAQDSPRRIGDFALLETVDPATREVRRALITPADFSNARGAAVSIRCVAKRPELLLSSRHSLARSGVRPQSAGRPFGMGDDWETAAPGTSATLRRERLAGFIEQARAARRVVFQLEDTRGSRHMYTLGFEGLGDALAWLDCGL